MESAFLMGGKHIYTHMHVSMILQVLLIQKCGDVWHESEVGRFFETFHLCAEYACTLAWLYTCSGKI